MMTISNWSVGSRGIVFGSLMAVPSFARAQNTADNDTTRQECGLLTSSWTTIRRSQTT